MDDQAAIPGRGSYSHRSQLYLLTFFYHKIAIKHSHFSLFIRLIRVIILSGAACMYQPKLMSPKEYRIQEHNASRVLQEESDRLSDQFIRLFVGGSIRHKHNQLISAKIANWDDEQDRKRNNVDIHANKKLTLPTRYRLKRKKIATIETQPTQGHSGMKLPHSKPTFSISLINPRIQQALRERPSQKLQKMRQKAASHLRTRFIQHLVTNSESKIDTSQLRNARVHSLNSQPNFTYNHHMEQKIGINFENINKESAPKLWVDVDKSSKSMDATLQGQGYSKKKIEDILQRSIRQKKQDASKQIIHAAYFNNIKLKKSKQFLKLRQLLSLQKI